MAVTAQNLAVAVKFCCNGFNCFGDVDITLLSQNSGTPLAFGVFGVYDTAGLLIASGLTDSSGKLSFSRMPCGDYVLREITPPPLYLPLPDTRTFRLTRAGYSAVLFNVRA